MCQSVPDPGLVFIEPSKLVRRLIVLCDRVAMVEFQSLSIVLQFQARAHVTDSGTCAYLFARVSVEALLSVGHGIISCVDHISAESAFVATNSRAGGLVKRTVSSPCAYLVLKRLDILHEERTMVERMHHNTSNYSTVLHNR